MTVELMGAPPRGGAVATRMSLGEKLDYARALTVAGLLPEHFRKNPGNVLWAMEYAEALNLPAIAAITGIHVIEGKPGPSAAMMAGLVRRAGHRLRVGYLGPSEGARWGTGWAEIVRKDDPEFTFRAEWTVERAVQAEICQIKDGKVFHRTKKGNAGNWQKFYIQMMKARALSEVSRDGAEECLMGMNYTAEELGADLDESGQPVATATEPITTPGPWERAADARPVTEHAHPDPAYLAGDVVDTPNPVVDADDKLGPPMDHDDTPGSITPRTVRAIMALFGKAGIGGKTAEQRATRLRVSEIIADRPLQSSTELSELQGRRIEHHLGVAGDDVATYVENLLRRDDEERAAEARAGEPVAPDGVLGDTPDAPDAEDTPT